LYEVLGITRDASSMDIALAYRALIRKWEASQATAEPQTFERKQQLERAQTTLLNPELKKKHDEKLSWYLARQKLDADRARQLTQRLKDEQEAAAEAAKAVVRRAAVDARRSQEEAERQAELDRIHAEADARFRQLREERLPFADTHPVAPDDDPDAAYASEETEPDTSPARAPGRIGLLTIVGSVVVVGVLFVLLLNRQPGSPQPAPASIAQAPQTSASEPAVAPAPAAVASASTAPTQPAASAKTAKEDNAKAAEALQYQKVLKRVEAEHPELNPKHAAHRPDLIAFVASRMQVHVKAGYAKPKALEVAMRDLETQGQIHQAIAQHKAQKEQATSQTPAVVDKGGHSGFDPKCRWLNSQEWSCK
jgi:hypothetical protein